ncbi:hypothetical protein Raf01_34280 [Rugosimonospora africana]|uniref:Uncharacterized protein n=1 Tax=Rugosimonospora africana TaxID=556532 RepID=A0A8J3QRL8_9ACTN|nr:hypothetical protein Raf01_34280 [Rugosimonospora africana]
MLMSGTQVQNVNVVAVFMALSMSDWLTGAPGAVEFCPDAPPQAVAATPARADADTTDSRFRRLKRRVEMGMTQAPR